MGWEARTLSINQCTTPPPWPCHAQDAAPRQAQHVPASRPAAPEEARDPDASSAGHEQTDRHFPFSEVGLGHSDPAMNYEVVSPGGPGPGPSCTEWV